MIKSIAVLSVLASAVVAQSSVCGRMFLHCALPLVLIDVCVLCLFGFVFANSIGFAYVRVHGALDWFGRHTRAYGKPLHPSRHQ